MDYSSYYVEATEKVTFSKVVLASSKQEAIEIVKDLLADDDTCDFNLEYRELLGIDVGPGREI